MSATPGGELVEIRSRVEAMAVRVSNWGRWGPDDELGTLNHLTAERRRAAAALVRKGSVFSLAIPFDRSGPQPPFERRLNPHLAMLDTGTDLRAGRQANAAEGWGYADDMVTMALQCATQWDALSHVFYDFRMYNDRDCALVGSEGAQRNSVAVARDRVVGRGVLLDVARLKGEDALPGGYEITAADLERCFETERLGPAPGDILLVRTGNLGRFRASGSWRGFTHAAEPGLGLDALPWLHEQQVAAVATDTWAVEVIGHDVPPDAIHLPFHAVGIVYMGLLLGEIFDLDALAVDCARDGVYEFMLAAPPLPFTGAVGSPINPLVLK